MVFLLVVLGIESKTSHMLIKLSTTELHLQPLVLVVICNILCLIQKQQKFKFFSLVHKFFQSTSVMLYSWFYAIVFLKNKVTKHHPIDVQPPIFTDVEWRPGDLLKFTTANQHKIQTYSNSQVGALICQNSCRLLNICLNQQTSKIFKSLTVIQNMICLVLNQIYISQIKHNMYI